MLFHTASPPNSLKKTRTKRWMKVSPLLSLTAFYVVLYILRRPIELTWIHWFMISHTNIFSMLTFFPWLSCIGSQQSRGQLYCVKSSISNVKEYKMHIYIYIYIHCKFKCLVRIGIQERRSLNYRQYTKFDLCFTNPETTSMDSFR